MQHNYAVMDRLFDVNANFDLSRFIRDHGWTSRIVII